MLSSSLSLSLSHARTSLSLSFPFLFCCRRRRLLIDGLDAHHTSRGVSIIVDSDKELAACCTCRGSSIGSLLALRSFYANHGCQFRCTSNTVEDGLKSQRHARGTPHAKKKRFLRLAGFVVRFAMWTQNKDIDVPYEGRTYLWSTGPSGSEYSSFESASNWMSQRQIHFYLESASKYPLLKY